ncbi:MAG: alpha-ribazole phosphatase [Bacteroidota bacterium]|nr:alpha-ribazole phosphatase [Odoribacter sp.]MDP3643313.1 alpha-ribazole phosphatase [Bacteroidota bacterium]
MQLTLIRHTSVDVPKGICYGITDVPLAQTFRREHETIRQKLKEETFDAAFSSPLNRCTKLAAEILPENDIRIDQRLAELDFGDWEMVAWNTIFESPEGKNWFADYVNFRCPNGESFTDLIQRGKSFLDYLKQINFRNVAIVSHAGMIRTLMCLIQHKTPEEAFYTPLEYGQIIPFNLEP